MKLTYNEIFNIFIEEFNKRNPKELDIYDEVLQEKLQKSPKTIQRYFELFQTKYNSIVEVKQRRKKTYKLITPIDLLGESLEHFEDIGWVFSMIQEGDPKTFKALEPYTQQEKHIYKFFTSPFEDLKELEKKHTFQRLKSIIKARGYAKIYFVDGKVLDNLKCLKLVFLDNNWYIAYVDNEENLAFGRFSFIQKVEYGSKYGSYQPSSVTKHLHFLENNIQNAMTLFYAPKQKAILQALPEVAHYFYKDMKKFLTSQRYIKTLEDGSVLFSVEYTQELEVLPFVQKWLPHIVVKEPQELQDVFRKKLQQALELF